MSHRPLGVAILAVLEVISGLLILALGAFIVIGNWSLDEGWRLSGPSGVLSILLLVCAAIFVIIGFLYLAVASGLWNESDWAWTLCCVLSAIGVFVGLFLSFLDLQNGIIIMLINIIALVYLMTHSVRAHFGKTSESKKGRAIRRKQLGQTKHALDSLSDNNKQTINCDITQLTN